MYTPQDIANWFLASIDREAGDSITHLKLQKLPYYGQAWSLALLDQALFTENFQAWAHGPVVPSIYQAYKSFGWEALEYPSACPKCDEDTENVLQEVLRVYGNLSARQLETLSHSEKPWIEARGGIPDEVQSQAVISQDSMQCFYKALYRTVNAKEAQPS